MNLADTYPVLHSFLEASFYFLLASGGAVAVAVIIREISRHIGE